MKINGDVIEFEYLSPVSVSEKLPVTAKCSQVSFDDLDRMEKIGQNAVASFNKIFAP